jgi:hypothetical protein
MSFERTIAENFKKENNFKNFIVICDFSNVFLKQRLREILSPKFEKMFNAVIQRMGDTFAFGSGFVPIMSKLALVFIIEFLRLVKENPGVYNEEVNDIDEEGKKDILFDLVDDWVDLVYDHLANRHPQLFVDEKYFSFMPKPLGRNLNRILNMLIFDFWNPEDWDEPLTVNFVRNRIIEMFKEPITKYFIPSLE